MNTAGKSLQHNDDREADRSTAGQTPTYESRTGIKGMYYHPLTQVMMLGLLCFMGPGLYNALTGLGGGGQLDATASANSNTAIYATFAVGAFFSGSIHNKLGSRLTLLLGSTGYSLYVGSFLALNIHLKAGPFVIASGAILGICAGLLWTAQGSLMLAYATEDQKGKFVGVFYSIFNLGAVVGASISLGENFHSTTNSVGNGTYIGFLVLTLIGILIPIVMANPVDIIRTDGTKVTASRHPSWKVEIYGLWTTLVSDPMILLLFPLFFASSWFYTWQFNEYNDALFNIRARSLNNLVYWLSGIVASISIGLVLDQKAFRRRVRAFSGWTILLAMVFIVHTWAFFYQRHYTRTSIPPDSNDKLDISDHRYAGRIWLYIFCGAFNAICQTTTYWLIGAMSNDPAKLSYLIGFFKSIQSIGAATAWRADAIKTPYMTMFLSTWALLAGGLVCALPMIYLRIKDRTELAEKTLMDDSGNILLANEEVKYHEKEKEKISEKQQGVP